MNPGTAKLFFFSIPKYFVVVVLSILRCYEANLYLSSQRLQARCEIFLENCNTLHDNCLKRAMISMRARKYKELLTGFGAYSDVRGPKNRLGWLNSNVIGSLSQIREFRYSA